jgi:hypothetical protein
VLGPSRRTSILCALEWHIDDISRAWLTGCISSAADWLADLHRHRDFLTLLSWFGSGCIRCYDQTSMSLPTLSLTRRPLQQSTARNCRRLPRTLVSHNIPPLASYMRCVRAHTPTHALNLCSHTTFVLWVCRILREVCRVRLWVTQRLVWPARKPSSS